MKNILFTFLFIAVTSAAYSQSLYIKTFGLPKAKPLIFLHGGPGYNSASFEATTAQRLSDSGFYVIVYDRRGEGRSKDSSAAFTFQQTFNDLKYIYQKYKLDKATLLGHSFGGIVAALFANTYPELINAVVLISAPVSLQQTFKTIISSSVKIYKEKNDTSQLKYLSALESMDTSSLVYSSYCFTYAMKNGFYAPKISSEERKNIYINFKTDSLAKYASQMTFEAPQGFWKNEHYTNIDLTSTIKNLIAKNIKVYGLYGKDDGLYSADQVSSLTKIITENHLLYLDNCSHNVFIDQQTLFINSVKRWVNIGL